jgi:hypothetical protein
MTKEQILAAIREAARANPGVALGRGRIEKLTGIKPSVWLGIHWARWGGALEEAGCSETR